MTAADVEVPMERMREFRPLAAAVSVRGTAPRISAGIAAKPMPIPAPMIMQTTVTCQTAAVSWNAATKPAPISRTPSIKVTFGPLRALISAETGASSIITIPAGASSRPAPSIDWAKPYPVA